ncbi:MAG TPA: FAD:protein FMN transferase [Candidatus Saccharimonadales bacterium]|nr:FAD:protein FMN transferase [Candidatus Saccharimonadales bacterium]
MPSTKSNSKPKPRLSFEAIGTQWQIDLGASPERAAALVPVITARINEFDKAYSRFRADSLITAISRNAGTYTLPADAPPLLALYRAMYTATDGAVTPLIGQALADAGYDAVYSLKPKQLTRPPAWEDVLHYRHPSLTVTQPVLLDFGAAGKGYLLDILADVLQAHDVHDYCIDAGGDMVRRTTAGSTLSVGLEDPDDTSKVIGTVTLANGSLCGSAGNRRKWASYHHILDPHTLRSPTVIKAVWVTADTALLADGMTTCLFFAPPATLKKRFSFEYALLHADGQVSCSAKFPGTLFTKVANTHHEAA